VLAQRDMLLKMFEAQDIIRRLWAESETKELEKRLKELDNKMLKIINILGEK
jgi:hypothetical protein